MTEQELRLLVREAIAKSGAGIHSPAPDTTKTTSDPIFHRQFSLPAPGSECIIEPSVSCNHCGYCKSYGH